MELQAKNLRIGNWYLFDGNSDHVDGYEPKPTRVRSLATVTVDGLNEAYHKPIRLTIEWLEKFGFEDYAYGRWELHNFGNNKVGRHILRVSHDDEELITLANDDVGRELNYVHDLQNWVFGRIGVDLIIKK